MRVSGLRPAQTKIPEVPDQTLFLERWYDFHRGYRIVSKEDGSEERVAVIGEDFKDVSPGVLPRTLEELRPGRRREEQVQQLQHQVVQEQTESGPSLEDSLDQMFQAATLEHHDQQHRLTASAAGGGGRMPDLLRRRQQQEEGHNSQQHNIHAQVMAPAGTRNRDYQARRVAALRRELHRMRNGIERVISGLRDLGEEVPDHSEATGRLTDLGRTLDAISGSPSREEAERAISSVNALANSAGAPTSDRTLANIQARVDEARNHLNEARRSREQAASELDLAESEFRTSQQRFQQLQREQRTTENYMRIFGTREEMLVQGDNYESPIGSMFTRAYERFRVAEEVRRETRTLRQVLEDEDRTGGEDEARRLAELEGMERDVWGVPRPRLHSPNPNRGEEGRRTDFMSRSRSAPEADEPAESVRGPQGDDAALEEYYGFLRRQGWSQQASEPGVGGESNTVEIQSGTTNFPRNMLDTIVAARERGVAESRDDGTRTPLLRPEIPEATEPQSDEPIYDGFLADGWWHQDAEHILTALMNDDDLRDELEMTPRDVSVRLAYLRSRVMSESDRMTLDALFRNPRVVWGTRLPTEWIQRRREHVQGRGLDLFLTGGRLDTTDETPARLAAYYNPYLSTEIMAQAFQMSSEVRMMTTNVSPPERLRILDRLQAGRRDAPDIAVLEGMRDSSSVYGFAVRVFDRTMNGEDSWSADARRQADGTRQQMARQGDHTRQELDASRRAAHSVAVAAGRQAMQTGPQALLERLVDRDEETRAAYHRLQANGFTNLRPGRATLYRQLTLEDYGMPSNPTLSSSGSDSDSDKEDSTPPARGLDARDTGRPEPKSDEDMRVQMDCKICYTQTAEIACLPCGHLVMCRWCSDQHSPVMQHDRTRPRRAAGCPVCRKAIRQKVRVFRA